MRALFVLGRAIFGGFFVFNGLNHVKHSHEMAQYAGAKGVPAAQQAVQATGLMLIAGGLSVVDRHQATPGSGDAHRVSCAGDPTDASVLGRKGS